MRFLVDREHDGVRRRIDIKADDIGEFLDEALVLRQFDRAHPMRGETVRFPDALDRTQVDADGLGHGAARPMGGFAGRLGKRQIDNPLDDVGCQRSLAGPVRLVAQQTTDALAHEALLPAPDNRLRQPRPAHDFQRAAAIDRGQNDAGARRIFLRNLRSPTIRSRRRRSSRLTSTLMAALIRRA